MAAIACGIDRETQESAGIAQRQDLSLLIYKQGRDAAKSMVRAAELPASQTIESADAANSWIGRV